MWVGHGAAVSIIRAMNRTTAIYSASQVRALDAWEIEKRRVPGFTLMTRAAEGALKILRARWPQDRYWDSFHAELSELARVLFEQVYRLPAGRFVAVEAKLPLGTAIPLGATGKINKLALREMFKEYSFPSTQAAE